MSDKENLPTTPQFTLRQRLLFAKVKFKRALEERAHSYSETEQLRYLPQSIKLEEATTPNLIKITMLFISSIILLFIIWAALTHINEVTKATGEVVPQGYVQVVQHLDGGIVTNIQTAEGALVEQGQTLVEINDGGAIQDLAEASAKLRFMQIEGERLRALITNEEPDFSKFTLNNDESASPTTSEANSEVDELNRRAKILMQNLQIAKEALNLQTKLHEEGHASKLTLLKYQKDVSDIESEAHSQLGKIETQIAQHSEVVKKLQARVDRLQVRSPVYGLVKGLQVNTIGGVIEPGATLMEIVPLDKKLVVEARISTKDIGHVEVGQTVRVKVSSYDFSRYGTVDGKLAFVSATTFFDQEKQPYYRGRILLKKNHVGANPESNVILPGMTVEADIITGRKTILNYLLKPIHVSLKTALTER